jgi:hypothetical protein
MGRTAPPSQLCGTGRRLSQMGSARIMAPVPAERPPPDPAWQDRSQGRSWPSYPHIPNAQESLSGRSHGRYPRPTTTRYPVYVRSQCHSRGPAHELLIYATSPVPADARRGQSEGCGPADRRRPPRVRCCATKNVCRPPNPRSLRADWKSRRSALRQGRRLERDIFHHRSPHPSIN